MPARTATARWEGSLQDGKGTMRLGSGAFEGQYSFSSRVRGGHRHQPRGTGSAPPTRVASRWLCPPALVGAGFTPNSIDTTANVRCSSGSRVQFRMLPHRTFRPSPTFPASTSSTFAERAEAAKAGCPVSKALAGVDIQLDARLGRVSRPR